MNPPCLLWRPASRRFRLVGAVDKQIVNNFFTYLEENLKVCG
jgi:hypothetical protein